MATKVTSYAKAYTKELAAIFQKRTRRVAQVVAEELRKNLSTPGPQPSSPSEFPHMQSGAMMRGVRTVVSKASPYTVRVKINAPHADFQEFGAKGGTIIVPKRAAALRFVAHGLGGKTVFTKRVKKGTLKGRHPIERTLKMSREKIRAIYTRGIPELKKRGGNKAVVRIS